MIFNPRFEVGEVVSNQDIVSEFKCGNMGGMRPSKATNALVIIADHTKSLYQDKWIGDVLHYTGMGKVGDHDLLYMQNRTLYESDRNGVNIYLFEVHKRTEYIYRGQVELCKKPYQEEQLDENNFPRNVWMFPVKLVE